MHNKIVDALEKWLSARSGGNMLEQKKAKEELSSILKEWEEGLISLSHKSCYNCVSRGDIWSTSEIQTKQPCPTPDNGCERG